jgi:hypothetical protein
VAFPSEPITGFDQTKLTAETQAGYSRDDAITLARQVRLAEWYFERGGWWS